jgi:hypothetical protein
MCPEERKRMGETGRAFIHSMHDISVLSKLFAEKMLSFSDNC